LLFNGIGNFCFDDFILYEYLPNNLILFVEDVNFAGQTTGMRSFYFYIYNCLSKTHGFGYLILGKVYGLAVFEFDKLEFEGSVFF
jgi:hypothetical protein